MANIAHIVFFLIIVDQCRNKVQGMFYIRRCSPGEHLLVSQPQDINDYAQQLNPSEYSSLWTVFNCRSGSVVYTSNFWTISQHWHKIRFKKTNNYSNKSLDLNLLLDKECWLIEPRLGWGWWEWRSVIFDYFFNPISHTHWAPPSPAQPAHTRAQAQF